MSKGFICIFTLDRISELRRFLTSFKNHNSLPISVLLAKDIAEAHRLKTKIGFLTPFDFTIFLDIDILVNGNLDEMFACAEQGNIGIIREKTIPVLNSGVIVFPKELMCELCSLWNFRYEKRLKEDSKGVHGVWDQDILNTLILNYPHEELHPVFNHILKDYTPEEELLMYDSVKIFHFLHHDGIDRFKHKSYQTYMAL